MKRIAILFLLLALLAARGVRAVVQRDPLAARMKSAAGDPDGAGVAVVTIDGTTLHYTVLAQNVGGRDRGATSTAARAGVNGQIVVPFEPTRSPTARPAITTTLAESDQRQPSGFYVNVHNSEFPNGAHRADSSCARRRRLPHDLAAGRR